MPPTNRAIALPENLLPDPKFRLGQILSIWSKKCNSFYKVKVIGISTVPNEHFHNGKEWFYNLRNVGSRGKLLKGSSIVSENWIVENLEP